MLQPKRTKYRKTQKGRMKGLSQRGHRLSNGMFGIKCEAATTIVETLNLSPSEVTSKKKICNSEI